MPPAAQPRDFFLCHAGQDKRRVDLYHQRLKARGASTAFDKYDIRPGQDWVERILDLLPSSKICVVFVSKHSSQAFVQSGEGLLARYLARQYPDRHKVIPVYLKGAPPQTALPGLQTTSGFREDRQDLKAIVGGLVKELQCLGDSADRATSTIEMIDEVALKWLFPPNHTPFRAQYRTRGEEMILHESGRELDTLSRDQFESKLSTSDRKMIAHLEEKMERLFREWEKHDLDSVTSKKAQQRADEFARRLGKEVVALLDLLGRAGFTLVDHYGHIRSVVAGYYAARN